WIASRRLLASIGYNVNAVRSFLFQSRLIAECSMLFRNTLKKVNVPLIYKSEQTSLPLLPPIMSKSFAFCYNARRLIRCESTIFLLQQHLQWVRQRRTNVPTKLLGLSSWPLKRVKQPWFGFCSRI